MKPKLKTLHFTLQEAETSVVVQYFTNSKYLLARLQTVPCFRDCF